MKKLSLYKKLDDARDKGIKIDGKKGREEGKIEAV